MIALNIAEEKHRKDLERLQKLRPIDDDFMRCLFKENIPLAELVLRIITGKPDFTITKFETQKDMKRLAGARSVCFDACGSDSTGTEFDVEIQRYDKGADPHRARYHISVMNVENLDVNQDFRELPAAIVIFITEKDFYGKGEPIYHIERMNLTTGEPFADGEQILYVNGEYRGDSDIGRLMHDFNCANADDMYFDLMAERTRYLKENPKGVSEMCKVIEEMRNEEREEGIKEGLEKGIKEGLEKGIKEGVKATALRMVKAGKYALEEIAAISGLSIDEVKKMQAE